MRPLIPRDRPKSFVISVIAGCVGILIAAPAVYAGRFLKLHYVALFGGYLLLTCQVIFAVMWIIFMIGKLTGRYDRVTEKEWRQQLW